VLFWWFLDKALKRTAVSSCLAWILLWPQISSLVVVVVVVVIERDEELGNHRVPNSGNLTKALQATANLLIQYCSSAVLLSLHCPVLFLIAKNKTFRSFPFLSINTQVCCSGTTVG
jgi:hypothetical protein